MITAGFSGTNRVLTISLFVLIVYIMFGYIFRYIAPNFEPALGLILLIGLSVLFKHRLDGVSQPVKLWMVVLLVYWLLTVGTTMLHTPLGDRSMLAINIASMCVSFAVLSYLLGRSKLPIDYFWYLMGAGSLLLAIVLGLEINAKEIDKVMAGVRIGRTYNHIGRLSVIAIAFFIVLPGALPWAFKKGRLFFACWCLLIMLDLTLVIMGQSRKAWLGLPVAVIGWGIYYGYMLLRSNTSQYVKGAFIFMPLIVVVCFASLPPIQTSLMNKINSFNSDVDLYLSGKNPRTNIGDRIISYEIAFNSIIDKPMLGIGEDAFPEFQKKASESLIKEKFNIEMEGYRYNHIHNQFLMAWLTKGFLAFAAIVGLFVYMVIFFTKGLWYADFRDKPVWIGGLAFTTTNILIFSATTPLHNSGSAAHFFLFLSLLVVFSSQTMPLKKQDDGHL